MECKQSDQTISRNGPYNELSCLLCCFLSGGNHRNDLEGNVLNVAEPPCNLHFRRRCELVFGNHLTVCDTGNKVTVTISHQNFLVSSARLEGWWPRDQITEE